MPRRKQSNAKGSSRAKDPIWEHVIIKIEAASSRSKPTVECCHCGETYSAGVTRLKQHFRGDSDQVRACPNCPTDLKLQLQAEQAGKKAGEARKRKLEQLDKDTSGPSSVPLPGGQTTVTQLFAKGEQHQVYVVQSQALTS